VIPQTFSKILGFRMYLLFRMRGFVNVVLVFVHYKLYANSVLAKLDLNEFKILNY
jgi:hypothetical protein